MAARGGGGAWKVAYADFTTAMMALFMVLWILSQDTEILEATSRYFQSPFNSPLDRSAGVLDGESVSQDTHDEYITTSVIEMGLLHEIAREFYRMLNVEDDPDSQPLTIHVTDDGLRIVVFDLSEHPLFEPDTAVFTEWGRLLMQNLAWLIESYQLQVRIDAHSARSENVSADPLFAFGLTQQRAHATQSALHYYAIPASRFRSVSAYGDGSPLDDLDPADADNDRIELSLHLPTK